MVMELFMSKLFPELFPSDGKNKYRYIVIALGMVGWFLQKPGLEGHELIYLYLMLPVGCWLVNKLVSDDERKS
jgi:hypothetical protein